MVTVLILMFCDDCFGLPSLSDQLQGKIWSLQAFTAVCELCRLLDVYSSHSRTRGNIVTSFPPCLALRVVLYNVQIHISVRCTLICHDVPALFQRFHCAKWQKTVLNKLRSDESMKMTVMMWLRLATRWRGCTATYYWGFILQILGSRCNTT